MVIIDILSTSPESIRVAETDRPVRNLWSTPDTPTAPLPHSTIEAPTPGKPHDLMAQCR